MAQNINYIYDANGSVMLKTYFDNTPDSPAGITDPIPYNGFLIGAIIKANTVCDYYCDTGKRGLTGHELGHGLGLGHIKNPAPAVALMGNNPNQMYYEPMPLDIELVNLIYH